MPISPPQSAPSRLSHQRFSRLNQPRLFRCGLVSTLLQRLAIASATFSRPSAFSRWRNDLISVPVLIDTGQGSAHVPSAAHVCIPSYSYSLSSCLNICELL